MGRGLAKRNIFLVFLLSAKENPYFIGFQKLAVVKSLIFFFTGVYDRILRDAISAINSEASNVKRERKKKTFGQARKLIIRAKNCTKCSKVLEGAFVAENRSRIHEIDKRKVENKSGKMSNDVASWKFLIVIFKLQIKHKKFFAYCHKKIRLLIRRPKSFLRIKINDFVNLSGEGQKKSILCTEITI